MNVPQGSPPADSSGPTAEGAAAKKSGPSPAAVAAARPGLRFLLASPWHFIALGFGSGLPRRAAGTWGTAAAWALFVLIDPLLSDLGWLGLIGAGLYFGAWAAQRTGEALGQPDSGHIVIDEMVAFWVVLVMLPGAATTPVVLQAAAFLLFRLLDIAKPPPARTIDRRWKNGIGAMADDLVAAFYTLLVIALWLRIAGA